MAEAGGTGPDVGAAVVQLLEAHGVRYVFGVPGGQTFALYRGILARAGAAGAVEHVLLRDERSAVFAADAYARASGTTGVCDATVGPGATNLVSGLGEAYAASVPVVAIVSDVARRLGHLRSRGSASQAIDQTAIFAPVTKWRGRIDDPAAVADVVDAAFRIANSGRSGPVLVEIPEDVFLSDLGPDWRLPRRTRSGRSPLWRCGPDPDAAAAGAAALRAARRPVILAGTGALAAGAEAAVIDLARRLRAPVATSITGKGVVAENDPWAIGVVGTMGSPVANRALAAADAVLAVGCKLGQGATASWTLISENATVVQVDSDAEELGRTYDVIGIWADARLGVEALTAIVGEGASEWDPHELQEERAAWRAEVAGGWRAEAPLRPQDVLKVLDEVVDAETMLVCDASLSSGWGAVHTVASMAGRSFLAPRGLAGLGWGAPAAIGTALARPDARVVCLAGDGAWAYSMGEVESMARLGLPILSVIINNSALAWVKHSQARRLDGQALSSDFSRVDFAASARGLGAQGVRVATLAELEPVLLEWKASRERTPTVVDVEVDDVETPVVGGGQRVARAWPAAR